MAGAPPSDLGRTALSRPTIEFLRYLLGRRTARTTVTAAETALLVSLAQGRGCVVEVGVFEGATSARLAAAIAPTGRLFLVDPFEHGTRPERWLGFSFTQLIARRSVARWRDQLRFVRAPSLEAARRHEEPAELVFIDADHSYAAVRADFLAWSEQLAPQGVLAFHDCRRCPARPDLEAHTGPVKLLGEILAGEHGPWSLVGEADSVSAIRRAE